MTTSVRRFVAGLWQSDAPLTATGLLMLPVLVVALAGLWLDPRMVAGAPVWLKPAKFAASIAIYTLTLAWVFGHLPAWTRTRRVVGRVTAVTLLVEIAIIAAQAARGTMSHFNAATPLDGALYAVMGLAILVQTLSSVAVAVALWRQRFEDRTLGWALRLGLTVTIIGAASGGLMTPPTEAQLAEVRNGGRLTVSGAHTVGAPDGGAGLPGTGWSTEHGDLRVPHFIGLHALQVFALLALALPRRWPEVRRVRLLLTGAASYVALFAILLAQAVGGESLVAPSPATAAALAVWALATAAAAWAAAHTGDGSARRPRPEWAA